MKKLKEIINNSSTGKKVLFLFILTNLIYAFMLIVTIPKTMTFSNGMGILDMQPMGYDTKYIFSLFEALGKIGREYYLYNQIPIDMIYPCLFGISNCLLIAYLLKKINKFNSAYFYLCIIPLISGIADYFENFGIIIMLNGYPNLSQTLMSFTSIFSIIKSMTTTLYFTTLILTLIIVGIKTFKNRKTIITNGDR